MPTDGVSKYALTGVRIRPLLKYRGPASSLVEEVFRHEQRLGADDHPGE